MKKIFLVILIAGIALVAVSVFQSLMRPGKGKPAPLFTLPSLAGNEVSLEALRGRPVLVVFWASWCGACRLELPKLSRLQHDLKGQGLELLAISVDDKRSLPLVRAIADALHPEFQILLDQKGAVADAYQSFMVPDSVLVGQNGLIAWRESGPVDWDEPEMRKKLTALVPPLEGTKPSAR